MQLVEGQPLDRLIPESGLPVERILEIATGLGEALVAAHAKGIVPRDLKPANVMVTAGSELLTDVHTREGVVPGTVPYMSPEQVSGWPLDHRTDIFSLGVMLYEMATGQRPFGGSSSGRAAVVDPQGQAASAERNQARDPAAARSTQSA